MNIAMKNKSAFTLFEMILVVVLIGTILSFVMPKIAKYMRQSEDAAINLKFSSIKMALNEYRMHFGGYPLTRQGLRALVENPEPNNPIYTKHAKEWPFLKAEDIADKAGTEFIYHCPPEKNKTYKNFELIYSKTGDESAEDAIVDGL